MAHGNMPPPNHAMPPTAHHQPVGDFEGEQTAPSVEVQQVSPYISRSRTYAFVVDKERQSHRTRLGAIRQGLSGRGALGPVQDHVSQKHRDQDSAKRSDRRRSDALPAGKGAPRASPGSPQHHRTLGLGRIRQSGLRAAQLRDRVENDFMLLELLDMSLEERLKGSRGRGRRDDLLAVPPRERMFRSSSTWSRWPRPSSTPIWSTIFVTATSSRPISFSSCPIPCCAARECASFWPTSRR